LEVGYQKICSNNTHEVLEKIYSNRKMLEFYILITGIIIILVILLYKDNYIFRKKEKEGFTQDNYYLASCPSGFNSYYDSNGNIMCCNGEIVANQCIADTKCSLTSSNNPDSCVGIILERYKEKSVQFCPSVSMPNYFEDGTKKGCTNGNLNSTLTGPANSSQSTCNIYDNKQQGLISVDSCLNQKRLDEAQCFGNNCSKSINSSGSNTPALISITFTDNMGFPHMAFTKESMEDYLNTVNPNWEQQGGNLSNNIFVADVAKAYYIDRTLQQSDIQF